MFCRLRTIPGITGALLSTVTVFFNFVPCLILFSSADLSSGSPPPPPLGAVNRGGGGAAGGGGGGPGISAQTYHSTTHNKTQETMCGNTHTGDCMVIITNENCQRTR